MITQNQALSIAKQIQAGRPDYLLCGSVALILWGAIPERKVLDIDFVCPADKFNPEGLSLYGGYGPSDFGGYLCYKVQTDNAVKGFYYNVFVHDPSVVIKNDEINGVKIQSIDQILFWKKKFNRAKDRTDLGTNQDTYHGFTL